MTEELRLDPYLDSLRGDVPTARDEARIRRRLTAAGLGLTTALISQTALAGAVPLVKSGVFSALALRFASLPLMLQMGLVTAGTAVVATGPVVVVAQYQQASAKVRARDASLAAQSATSNVRLQTANHRQTVLDSSVPEPTVTAGERVESAKDESATAAPKTPHANTVQSRPPTAEGEEASSLSEETRLIDAALAAIRRGNRSVAEQLLKTHAQRFPGGRLTHERQRAELKLREASTTERQPGAPL